MVPGQPAKGTPLTGLSAPEETKRHGHRRVEPLANGLVGLTEIASNHSSWNLFCVRLMDRDRALLVPRSGIEQMQWEKVPSIAPQPWEVILKEEIGTDPAIAANRLRVRGARARGTQDRPVHLRNSAMAAPATRLAPRNQRVTGSPMRPMTTTLNAASRPATPPPTGILLILIPGCGTSAACTCLCI
jgi:hypothetical protein